MMYNEDTKGMTPMNRLYKLLFAATSMVPITGAYALNQFHDGDLVGSMAFIGVGMVLTGLCWIVLKFAERNQQTEPLHVVEVALADKEILAFLIAYMLPVISRESFDILANPLNGVFVLGILLLCGGLRYCTVGGTFWHGIFEGKGVSRYPHSILLPPCCREC